MPPPEPAVFMARAMAVMRVMAAAAVIAGSPWAVRVAVPSWSG